MNERQRTSLIKLFWDLSKICIAIAVIGNIVKPDVPVIKTVVLVGISIIFFVLAFVMDSRK